VAGYGGGCRRPDVSATEPDYGLIRRQMPVTKGKWRIVSKEVEDAADEST
jgi:hypothetical protein